MNKKRIAFILSLMLILSGMCQIDVNAQTRKRTTTRKTTTTRSKTTSSKQRKSTGTRTQVAKSTDTKYNGHECVDLGLPSGTKWATCNVGANKPEDYGDYFAWGETKPKEDYDWKTYKWCDSDGNITKYCTDSDYGIVDNKTTLDPADDAAHVNWGSGWRMPTFDELEELEDKCTWTWTSDGGHNGFKVKGPNGNTLFLPAAGVRGNSSLSDAGSNGYYWSRTLNSSYPSNAYNLNFNANYFDWELRYYGQSVRPVRASE